MSKSRIRIGIDARTFGAARVTGVERYVRSLVAGLGELPDLPECYLYVDSTQVALAPPVPMSHSMTMRVVPPGRAWLRWRLPRALMADRISVMHFPATVMPPFVPCRSVVTAYDLAFEHYPESYEPADLRMQLQGARRSIKRANRVLAISDSTRDDIIRLYGRKPEDITMTPLGVEQRFTEAAGLSAPRGWPERFILYVGSLVPRKNLPSLLEAYAIARSHGVAETLVLAGGGSHDYIAHLRSKALGLDILDYVMFAGYLDDDLLPAAYLNARAFVYLSLYEGFGLPVLEAMACGAPVLASNSSCFPELVGDAGLLVNPKDVAAQAHALVDLLTEEGNRQRLAAAARARARDFTWRRTAELTLQAYLAAAA